MVQDWLSFMLEKLSHNSKRPRHNISNTCSNRLKVVMRFICKGHRDHENTKRQRSIGVNIILTDSKSIPSVDIMQYHAMSLRLSYN